MTEISKPQILTGLNRYTYIWDEFDIRVVVDRVEEEGRGELSVWHENGQGRKLLLMKNANLLSSTACSTLSKQLNKHLDLDWDTILTYVTALTLDQHWKEPLEHPCRGCRNQRIGGCLVECEKLPKFTCKPKRSRIVYQEV